MRIKFFGLLLLAGVLMTSCVSRKQLVYLQTNGDAAPRMMKAVPTPEYRLQANDMLSIRIKALDPELVAMFAITDMAAGGGGGAMLNRGEEAHYYDGFAVNDRGMIRIPTIGELNVLGNTLEEVRIKIEKELLERFFKEEANIFVTVKLAGMRFTINGEIAMPGTMIMFQEKVNILEAIANRGDITIVGDRKNVTIIRQYPYGTEMHDIDLTDIKVMESPYFYLQPNDYIYIKPLPQKTWGTGKTGLESLQTFVAVLSLATTTYLLLTR
jgi:polysaccharide export outer membrane protein